MPARAGFSAVILDLDGVITDTASLHARAWKRVFDDYLERLEAGGEGPFARFDAEAEYLSYVDGKPRYDGVRSFLASRGISLPDGDSADEPDRETICGLGNRKNDLYNQLLEKGGVTVFEDAVARIAGWRGQGLKTAVVSSSKNCAAVLDAAGLTALFDERVDGLEAERLNLDGKPAPDIFLEATRRLGVEPERAVVVEDALSGVEAGRAGGFGWVIGIDRARIQGEALRAHGADDVVADLWDVRIDA